MNTWSWYMRYIRNPSFILGSLSILLIAIYFGAFLVIPFLLSNQLITWDTAGLYFSAWYEKNYLFPHAIGWNPFFFAGYPQHQFYPPLYAYTSALLSFLMPLQIAFKLLFSVTLFLLPLSFYYFARSFLFSKVKSCMCMLAMSSVLFLFPNSMYGGNMHATFTVGLITHALGLALFFFYFGSLQRSIKKPSFVLPTLLFSLVILTHIVAAFAASLLFITYALLYTRSKKRLGYFLSHGMLTFLLTAFWVVPFIGKISYLEAVPIGGITYSYVIIGISIAYLLFTIRTQLFTFSTIGIFMLLLVSFSFFQEVIPIHLYRFMMFFYLLLPFMLFSLIRKDSILLWGIVFVLSAGVFVFSTPVDVVGKTPSSVNSFTPPEQGRLFVMAPYTKQESPHYLQHALPLLSNTFSLRGLYIESAQNARYIFDLEHELEPEDSFVWGTYIDYPLVPDNTTLIRDIINPQLRALGVNSVIAPRAYSPSWEARENITSYVFNNTRTDYRLYLVDNSSLIEILSTPPRSVYTDWDFESAAWFLSREVSERHLVFGSVPSFTASGNESVTLLASSPRQDYLHFFVNSTTPVPVLIKISHFPNWHAYQQGEHITIYRASPYFMLVYGYGDIELRYEPVFVDLLGTILSCIGLLLLIIAFFVRNF